MPLEEDIESFCTWLAKLGCPPDSIPNEEALKSIFKSPQRDLFCNMMNRVQSLQDVRAVRENILIKDMEQVQRRLEVLLTCGRRFLPKQMQIYVKKKDLMKEKDELTAKIVKHEKDFNTLDGSIKRKHIKCINVQHKLETLQAKNCILELKSDALDSEIQQERDNTEKIIKTTPVKLSEENVSDLAALEAVKKALKELDCFYSDFIGSTSPDAQQAAKDELWKKMRCIFSNTPNFLIFNTIMRLKEEQLQNIVALNDSIITKPITTSFRRILPEKPISVFKIKLMQARVYMISMAARFANMRQKRIAIEQRFAKLYCPFVNEMKKQTSVDHESDKDRANEIISDFIVQYNLRHFTHSKIVSVKQQIKYYEGMIEAGAMQLKNHETLIGSGRQIYADISTSFNRVQQEMIQLGQIEEKIVYSINRLTAALKNMQVTGQFQSTRIRLNDTTLVNIDSFEISGDNVFSSTKLDFDSSIALNRTAWQSSYRALDATIIPADGQRQPPHLDELNAFAQLPIEKFHNLSRECAFFLSANPLVVESTELFSTQVLAPGVLLTPFGVLQKVRAHLKWADAIAAHSNDLKLNSNSIIVDGPAYEERIRQQGEQIAELLDRIDATAVNTNHTQGKNLKLFDFIRENPLRHHIPATKCFNGETYADYENEFTIYYRIVTGGATLE